jgi:GNAT superfamily N-acetyltransferase
MILEMATDIKILQTFSPPEIIKCIVDNYLGFRLLFSRLPGAVLHTDSNIVWLDSGCPRVSWNGILRIKNAGLQFEQEILEIVQYFNTHQRQFGCWINPVDFSNHIVLAIQQQGFLPVEETAAMAVDLKLYNQSPRVSRNLTIVPVKTYQELNNFTNIVSRTFSISAQCRHQLHQLFESVGFESSCFLKNYIGIYNGLPAVSASLFLNSGVVGIYYLGTLPELRGKGLATELTLYLMNGAKELGFRVAVLRASRMGEGIYRRLGFEEFFKFNLLLYRND